MAYSSDFRLPAVFMILNAPKILLAEDVVPYRERVRDLLRELGYPEVLEASNGREAISILCEQPIDLVISDFCMSPLSGLDVLRAMRRDLPLDRVPFVMMTGVGDESTISQAEKYGVTSYLKKPLHTTFFQQSIDDALKGRVTLDLSEKYKHLRTS